MTLAPRPPRRLPRLVAVLSSAALCACQSAAGRNPAAAVTPAAGPTQPAITAADLRTRLYIFADDSMLGREAGTIGNVRATDYIASELRRLGLEPAGENGTYFQTVPIVTRRLADATALSAGGSPLTLGTDYLPIPTVSFLPIGGGGSLDGVTAIYGGHVGDSVAAITPAQAAGKLVVLAPPRAGRGAPFAFWTRPGLERFSGAAGVAIATLDISPPTIRDYFGSPQEMLADPSPDSTPVGLIVTRAAAEQLLGAPLATVRPEPTGRRVSGQIVFENVAPPAPARNVVAILRGADPAVREQYVAIGAHSDHEGIADRAVDHDSLRAFNREFRPLGANSTPRTPTPAQLARVRATLDSLRAIRVPRADSIYNGADDDGSGSVTLLEIAEALASNPDRPRRSTLFVWHTAEEKGLYGSEWFTDRPTVPRDSIVAQLNMDMVGRGAAHDIEGGGPRYLQIIGSRRLATELGDRIDAVNAALEAPFVIDYSFDANGHPLNRYCRSDHYNYARYGIPISYFSRGYHIDYHQVTDEPQYIDYESMANVARLIRAVALDVADAERRLVVDGEIPDPQGGCRQ